MTTFAFKGRSLSGNKVDGTIEAPSSGAAAGQLVERGITPIDIVEDKERQDALTLIKRKLLNRRPSLQELLFFSRQMYTLTKAGVPLVKSLNSLLESAQNPRIVQALIDIISALDGGRELSAAMKDHPNVFPSVFVSMVHVGENTGKLEEAFLQIAENLESEIEIRKRIKSATRYPSFVVIAIVIAMVIVNVFVIPQFASVFKSFKAELPIFTRILIGTSNFTVNYWPYLLAIIIASVFAASTFLKTTEGRYMWDRFKLRIPIFGSILHRIMMVRFAFNFAMTTHAGVPISQALSITASAEDNVYVSGAIIAMRNRVERGEPLSRTVSASGLFTPVVIQMIAVGEESGMVDTMLREVAEFYEREVDYDMQKLSASIEPIMLAVIGAMVLVLALGIFLPMWDLGKAAIH